MNIRSFRKDALMENPFNMKAVKLLDLPEGEIIHLTLGGKEEMVKHIPPVTLAIYILEGSVAVVLNGDKKVLTVDDCLEVPGGSRLSGINRENQPARMIICRIPRPVTAPILIEDN